MEWNVCLQFKAMISKVLSHTTLATAVLVLEMRINVLNWAPLVARQPKYVTPISSLISKTRFKGSQTLSSAEVRDSVSTPGDSGFSSLTWDRSEDSISDQEGSLQELFQKGTPRVGDLVKKPKHPGRLRRLSTLREQGSQSEMEDEKQMVPPDSETSGCCFRHLGGSARLQ